MQIFRAPSQVARLDWVVALAVLSTAQDLGLQQPLPPPVASHHHQVVGSGPDAAYSRLGGTVAVGALGGGAGATRMGGL
ncbi:unnamed protein product, partial [Choristocarpus tenellus]